MPININKRSDVNSVNGKVGDVMLNASDIGALSKDTKIPSKTSELINDSNYVADSDYKHTDNNYTTTDKNSVATIGNKVDKVEGKGLSTNDLTDELKADYDDAVLQAHTHNNKDILDNTTASYTTEERTKLSGIENNAQKNTVIGVKGEVETDYRVGNVNITKENIGLENVANERQWSETNHPTTISGYGITDSASSTDYNTLKGRVDTNEDNIAMLDSDVESLTTDVGMLETDMTTVKSAVTTIQDDYVPKTRKVNGKSLSADITLSASDVKAIPISQKGTSNGVAELDGNGLVPSSQLPSYVDDVLEYDTKTDFPTNGESGKIYIATDTNLQYRWTGTQYAEISSSLALGETSSTAYRGDRGKIAYDHSQKASGNPHNVTKSDVGLSNVPNVTTNDQTPTFTESTTLTKLTSGEKLSVAFGKISKSITDLINHIANKNNPHEVTKTQVGLGNVGNFKAVSTVASQGLTDTEKANARANIGAGTGNSNFSGSYNDLTNKPALGTAATKNVPASGNATTDEIVMGNDSRLTNSRPASDVYSWAKASVKPSYTKSEIGLGSVDNTTDVNKPVSTAQQKAIDAAYANSNKYTDKKIADLINGAPETMDTLKEVSDAINASKSVEEALNKAIGTKANQTELDTHTGNDTIHITATERTNWNDANSKKHSHANKTTLDDITADKVASWDKISNKIDTDGNASNTTVAFKEATTRTNLTTGEKISISFGKIAKWFNDLKTVAFSGNYNDLTNKPTIPSVGNGTVTITQNGASKGTFTMNQSGNTTIALTDTNTNTWRDVVDNLSSTRTDASLSANQGRILGAKLPFALGIDADGNYGYYKAGADTVTPFSTDFGDIILGNFATHNLGSIRNPSAIKSSFDSAIDVVMNMDTSSPQEFNMQTISCGVFFNRDKKYKYMYLCRTKHAYTSAYIRGVIVSATGYGANDIVIKTDSSATDGPITTVAKKIDISGYDYVLAYPYCGWTGNGSRYMPVVFSQNEYF